MNRIKQLLQTLFTPNVDSITKDFTKKVAKLDTLKNSLANKNLAHLELARHHTSKAQDLLNEYSRAERIRNRINQLIED